MDLPFAFGLSCSWLWSSSLCLCVPLCLFTQGKSQTLAVKRKAESEEEEESPSVTALLPARSSPVTDSPKNMEEKSGLGGEVQMRAVLASINDLILYST